MALTSGSHAGTGANTPHSILTTSTATATVTAITTPHEIRIRCSASAA